MSLQYHLGQGFAVTIDCHVFIFPGEDKYSLLGIMLADSFDDMFTYVYPFSN